ncbi:MAG: ATP-binding protein, partial [bacterium]
AQINRQIVYLPDLAQKVMDRFRVQTQRSQIAIEFHAAQAVPPVSADRDRLDQVLANLISNAVKFTPPGGRIQVSVTAAADAMVKTTICDSGTGIPAEDQPRIFERFYRVDKARSRSLGGTGLGLSIAQQIIEAHGGRIQLASVVGEGTTVSFILPAASHPVGGKGAESRDQDGA